MPNSKRKAVLSHATSTSRATRQTKRRKASSLSQAVSGDAAPLKVTREKKGLLSNAIESSSSAVKVSRGKKALSSKDGDKPSSTTVNGSRGKKASSSAAASTYTGAKKQRVKKASSESALAGASSSAAKVVRARKASGLSSTSVKVLREKNPSSPTAASVSNSAPILKNTIKSPSEAASTSTAAKKPRKASSEIASAGGTFPATKVTKGKKALLSPAVKVATEKKASLSEAAPVPRGKRAFPIDTASEAAKVPRVEKASSSKAASGAATVPTAKAVSSSTAVKAPREKEAAQPEEIHKKSWCADCWAPALTESDTCTNHRLVTPKEAINESNAEGKIRQVLKHQADLALALARAEREKDEQEADTLQLEVQSVDGDAKVVGGTVMVRLATSKLTKKEKDAICRSLRRMDVILGVVSDEAFGEPGAALKSVIEKLPQREHTTTLKAGTLLVSSTARQGNHLQLLLADVDSGRNGNHLRPKVLGYVSDNLGAFDVSGCDGCNSSRYDGSCFCITGVASTQIKKAVLL